MIVPRINRNGTDGKVLIDEYLTAAAAVSNAIDRLFNVTIHGRDYQTMPSGSFTEAFSQHRKRIAMLTAVRDELIQTAERIDHQLRERKL